MQHEASDEPEVVLTGGSMNEVVRRGQAVYRTAGPWTPTVHRLLEHLRANGIDWLPRPLGLDERGREVLTYLPGTVPSYPMPPWVWSEDVLVDAGRRLADLHRASAGFDHADAIWQLPAHEPAEVVCLNDVGPYNMVFDDGHRLSGFIDVDTASPGPRAWDLAYLVYRLVPLSQFEDTADELREPSVRRRRLTLLGQAYAHAGDRATVDPRVLLETVVVRLDDLAAFTAARAAAGAPQVASHVQGYRDDARWVEEHLDDLMPVG